MQKYPSVSYYWSHVFNPTVPYYLGYYISHGIQMKPIDIIWENRFMTQWCLPSYLLCLEEDIPFNLTAPQLLGNGIKDKMRIVLFMIL
ncbi:hypothetical protein GDO86_011227 [Hymenochirus boettgeri]|uniref:Uncharacterized protein n=1 Tax=Hymenochirus boettgeri TaxID=247094 RepID=A0A8T2JAQ4_9PIPI|nr:hypothetical protein GDO86_011227 [Hymenochirus boettgeri]